MANELFSKLVPFYYSPTDSPYAWEMVACLTDKSFNGTTNNIEVNSDCEGTVVRNLPGDVSWSFEISGLFNTVPAPDISNNDLFTLWNERTVGFFKLDDGNGYVRIGEGYVSSFTETGTAGQYMTFTATITNAGAIADVELS